MLAAVRNVPETDADWLNWSFDQSQALETIRMAIQSQYGITLPARQVFPMNPDALGLWVQNVSSAHQDFVGLLGLHSTNLLDVDLRDQNQKTIWVEQIWRDMSDAFARLGVG